jgi:hypothetical protein
MTFGRPGLHPRPFTLPLSPSFPTTRPFLSQAGVAEMSLFTAYMVKGGIHELEKRLHVRGVGHVQHAHLGDRTAPPPNPPPRLPPLNPLLARPSAPPQSQMMLRSTLGRFINPDGSLAVVAPGGGAQSGAATPSVRRIQLPPPPLDEPSPPPPEVDAAAAALTPRVDSPGPGLLPPQRASAPAALLGDLHDLKDMPSAPPSPSPAAALAGGRSRKAMLAVGGSRVRIDPSARGGAAGGAVSRAMSRAASGLSRGASGGASSRRLALYDDAISEAASDATDATGVTATSNVSMAAATSAAARQRFLSSQPSQKAGVAQLRERWWRDAVVRVDACLRKRYRLNGASLVLALQDTAAPSVEQYAGKLAEIAANPEKVRPAG